MALASAAPHPTYANRGGAISAQSYSAPGVSSQARRPVPAAALAKTLLND
jgi:hypothetical protein